MIKAKINDARIEIFNDENLISSTQGIYTVTFDFDENWDRYSEKIAVFQINYFRQEVALLDNLSCEIPKEIMKEVGKLQIGVYAKDSETLKSTVLSNPIELKEGSLTNTKFY